MLDKFLNKLSTWRYICTLFEFKYLMLFTWCLQKYFCPTLDLPTWLVIFFLFCLFYISVESCSFQLLKVEFLLIIMILKLKQSFWLLLSYVCLIIKQILCSLIPVSKEMHCILLLSKLSSILYFRFSRDNSTSVIAMNLFHFPVNKLKL